MPKIIPGEHRKFGGKIYTMQAMIGVDNKSDKKMLKYTEKNLKKSGLSVRSYFSHSKKRGVSHYYIFTRPKEVIH